MKTKTPSDPIGRWYHAKQTNGEGFMIIEVTGFSEEGLVAKVVSSNLSEMQALAECQSHNDTHGRPQ